MKERNINAPVTICNQLIKNKTNTQLNYRKNVRNDVLREF
jgi:hypothetical protein